MAATAAERAWTGGRPLREAYGEMAWRRPGLFRRELILEAGSEQLASLTWEKWYGFEAAGESADGRWHLRRRRISSVMGACAVLDAGTGAEVATFARNWRGSGEVRFASGARYAWKPEGFWRRTYSWTTESGARLIGFRARLGFGATYEMTIEPAARSVAELPVLVLLGGYVMAMLAARRHSG